MWTNTLPSTGQEYFDMELDHFTKTDTVYVLNTFVFAIIDFAPSVFFKLAQNHSIKFGNT